MASHFYKYQGTGNDFILIDNTKGDFNHKSSEYIVGLCHRHFGIGADGLILLQGSDLADFEMVYFNADGHLGTMCGNGGRCATHLAHQLGLVGTVGKFIGPDGIHEFRIRDNQISITMREVTRMDPLENGYFVDTGSPHLVCFLEEINDLDVASLGRQIRNDFGEAGTNVNFVCQKEGKYSMRTYERGVEAETLSCGTGATAVAIALKEVRGVNEESITLETLGGKLTVSSIKKDGYHTNVWLSGPVVLVFKGELF
jgi:diaminopimelate epimerase